MKEKLMLLISKCKGQVSLTINEHRNANSSLGDYLLNSFPDLEELDFKPETALGIAKQETLVVLRWYPNSSVGFCTIIHYDPELALDEALADYNG
jgi:hypothetical protein